LKISDLWRFSPFENRKFYCISALFSLLAKQLFSEEKKCHVEERAKRKHENNIKSRIKNEENTN